MTDKSNEVYRIVLDNPGIDAPLVCLQMNSNDIADTEDREHLAEDILDPELHATGM